MFQEVNDVMLKQYAKHAWVKVGLRRSVDTLSLAEYLHTLGWASLDSNPMCRGQWMCNKQEWVFTLGLPLPTPHITPHRSISILSGATVYRESLEDILIFLEATFEAARVWGIANRRTQ